MNDRRSGRLTFIEPEMIPAGFTRLQERTAEPPTASKPDVKGPRESTTRFLLICWPGFNGQVDGLALRHRGMVPIREWQIHSS